LIYNNAVKSEVSHSIRPIKKNTASALETDSSSLEIEDFGAGSKTFLGEQKKSEGHKQSHEATAEKYLNYSALFGRIF